MIKAVVFDADGTLFNSFELIVGAYHHVATSHGLQPPTAEQVREQLGLAKSLPDIYRTFFPNAAIDRLVEANGEYIAANTTSAAAFEGLEDTLSALRDMGLSLAILTGGGHKVQQVLAEHGIADYFGSVVHHERVQQGKPHPEGFLLIAQELGVPPEAMIMVGDSPNDIAAGKNGGAAATIGITHGNASREDLQTAGADYLVDSLAECLARVRILTSKQ
ncbi:MAG TPA: HAD family hydrolase [Candidatus Saccharimonadales bacterium]|nr:HAD family hydrolase [Candidatus Saccharimonadales bacterium]